MKEWVGRLREELKPLYRQILEDVKGENSLTYRFCAQWGKHYEADNRGILFVGRANNDWGTKEQAETKDVDILFEDEKLKIFDCDGALSFMLPGNQKWNSNRSPFVRVLREVAKGVVGNVPDWTERIAYSNLYKIGPYKGTGEYVGNPSSALCVAQVKTAAKILKAEISWLNPRFVVFFTGKDWFGRAFWDELLIDDCTNSLGEDILEWGRRKKYKPIVREDPVRHVVYIVTEHPQAKPEYEHVKLLADIINRVRI